jgi:hypothetical protein
MLKQGFGVSLKPHKGAPQARRRPLDCELYSAMVDTYKARSMVPPRAGFLTYAFLPEDEVGYSDSKLVLDSSDEEGGEEGDEEGGEEGNQ